MAMMQLWAAVLIIYGVSTGIAQIPLNMAPESVDDMYDNCSNTMNSTVNMYLLIETQMDANFSDAWELSDKVYESKSEAIKPLEKELFQAIYVYTLNEPEIYRNFNHAVRTQKSQYNTTFRYHALHFFLTRAIQTLNARQKMVTEGERCLTTYRRTNVDFSQDVLNKEFRFGSFTSSSQGDYPSVDFGEKSCFEIVTCFGADIQQYSAYGDEREVLIPPYEVFNVTKIITRTERNINETCEVIYEVKSTCTSSNLNCALFHE